VAGHDPLDRAPSDEAALQQIGQELDGPLFLELTTPEERERFHRWILTILRRENPTTLQLRRANLLGGVAVGPVVGGSAIRIATGLTVLGLALVLITIELGR
jgi:hypothetical protein